MKRSFFLAFYFEKHRPEVLPDVYCGLRGLAVGNASGVVHRQL